MAAGRHRAGPGRGHDAVPGHRAVGALSTLPVEVALREQIEILERHVADLERHNRQLREAVDALLQPASSELLTKNMAHASRMKR